MPSPLGHALAGVAAGCLARGAAKGKLTAGRQRWLSAWKLLSDKEIVAFAGLGMLADIDFVFGTHSTQTHSVGAIVVVGLLSRMVGRRARLGVSTAAAYGSHVLLDWLGSDAMAPIGVMALWPLSSDFFLSDRYWFASVCREYWRLECWTHNASGVAREVLILAPVALGAILVASRVAHRDRRRSINLRRHPGSVGRHG